MLFNQGLIILLEWKSEGPVKGSRDSLAVLFNRGLLEWKSEVVYSRMETHNG